VDFLQPLPQGSLLQPRDGIHAQLGLPAARAPARGTSCRDRSVPARTRRAPAALSPSWASVARDRLRLGRPARQSTARRASVSAPRVPLVEAASRTPGNVINTTGRPPPARSPDRKRKPQTTRAQPALWPPNAITCGRQQAGRRHSPAPSRSTAAWTSNATWAARRPEPSTLRAFTPAMSGAPSRRAGTANRVARAPGVSR
jgi:hypothetical protein